MDQKIIDLYDEYTHAPLDRRIFLSRLAALVGSSTAAVALLSALEPNFAIAATIARDDARLATESITYPGASGPVRSYAARPKGTGRLPAVVVIHENRGLNPHIEDVVRRAALEGFLAIGPDLLSPLGGTPEDPDQARDLIGKLDQGQTVGNLVKAVDFLKSQPGSSGKVGGVGFCWGGGMTGQLAVNAPDLGAAVVFYGPVPAAADVPKIKARLLLHYAGLDERINAGVPGFEAALKAAGVKTPSTCTRASTTPFTTIPVGPATTRRRRSWRGSGRLPSSGRPSRARARKKRTAAPCGAAVVGAMTRCRR